MEQTHDAVDDQPHDTDCHDGEDIPGLSSRHRRRLVTLRHSSPYCVERTEQSSHWKIQSKIGREDSGYI